MAQALAAPCLILPLDLYCLGMPTDLSQSVSLNMYRSKDYMLLISTADRVDLVLFYSFIPIEDK